MCVAKNQAAPSKRFASGTALACLVILVGFGLSGCNREPRTVASPAPSEPVAPAAAAMSPDLPAAPEGLSTDPELVFRRAFWRRPGAGDEILHAERREKAGDGASVAEWRWYLVVKPGPELRAWLATNPFSLHPAPAAAGLELNAAGHPVWFAPDWQACEVRQNPEGRLIFAYSTADNLLYATDSGHGFTAPARAP